MAFDLFCNFKFKESLEVFLSLNICPSHVVGLFPGLLPAERQDMLEYPDTPPVLQGRELENGLLALIEYLTQVTARWERSLTHSFLSDETQTKRLLQPGHAGTPGHGGGNHSHH